MKLTDTASRWLVWPLLAVALVAAGAAARWFDPPVITETTVDVKVVRREVVKWKTTRAVDTYMKKTPVWLPAPDGGAVLATIEEHSTRDRSTAESSSTATTTTASSSTRSTKLELSRYRVGAQVGASWREPGLQIAGPLVLGVTVDVRLGNLPVWLGVWGGTYGAAGGALTGEF